MGQCCQTGPWPPPPHTHTHAHPRPPGFCIKSAWSNSSVCCDFLRFLCLSVNLSQRLGGLLLHTHLAAVCTICAFGQQVITNRSLTSYSVQLDSLCWLGQGQLQEEAGWQQLDSTHYRIKGNAAESQRWKLPCGENMWRKMPVSSRLT